MGWFQRSRASVQLPKEFDRRHRHQSHPATVLPIVPSDEGRKKATGGETKQHEH